MPLSILHVLAPADVGGLETVVRALASGHTALGHSVEIAAILSSPSSPFVQEARDAGLRVHIIESPPRSVLPEYRGVKELLTQGKFDVLHSHGYRSDILDIRIAHNLGIPSTTTLHGFSAIDWKARLYEWLQLRSTRSASAIVAVSKNVADRVVASGTRSDLVHLIRNAAAPLPVSLNRSDALATLTLQQGAHIGWIGRLSHEKGPDVMLDAMFHLTDIPVTLSFLGEGPQRTMLERRAASRQLREVVRFHGRVVNAPSVIHAFDLIVLSSRTEGTPMVALEAMAAGVPIVATGVGGIPDMLSNSEAFIVPPEDPEALALAIRAVLADRAASIERTTRARQRLATDFGKDAWLARYEALYRSIQPARSAGTR